MTDLYCFQMFIVRVLSSDSLFSELDFNFKKKAESVLEIRVQPSLVYIQLSIVRSLFVQLHRYFQQVMSPEVAA